MGARNDANTGLQHIVEAIPGAVVLFGPDQRVKLHNEAFRAAVPRASGDLIGAHCRDLAPEGDRAYALLKRVSETGEGAELKGLELVTADGDRRWFEATFAPVANGTPLSDVLVIAKDITDRKGAEEALRLLNERLEAEVGERTRELRESEARHRWLFQTMREAVVIERLVSDDRGNIVDWVNEDCNPAFLDLMGLRGEEFRGKRGSEIMSPESFAFFKPLFERAKGSDGPTTTQFRSPATGREFLTSTAVEGDLMIVALTDVSEIREAQRRAEELAARDEAMLGSLHEGLVLIDASGKVAYANPAAARAVGFSTAEELMGAAARFRADMETFHPDGRPMPVGERPYSRAVRGETFSNAEMVIRRPGAGEAVASYNGTPVVVNGQRVGSVLTIRDVTEQKRAEATIRESREDLSLAQSVSKTGSWRIRVRTNELLWSDETYRMLGVPPGTPMSYERFLDVVHPDDRGLVDERWRAALRGEPYDVEHRITVGGEVKWVREKAVLEFEGGELLGVFGTVQDVTERRQTEEGLRESEEKFAKAFHGNAAAMSLTRLDDGTVVDANERWLEVHGLTRWEAIGRSSLELGIWAVPEQRKAMVEALERHGSFEDREVEFLRRGGHRWTALMSSQVISLKGERIMLSSLLDITDRKRWEEELKRSNAELQQFAYVASHDLQEPLRMVLSYTGLLEKKYGGSMDEQARRYAHHISEGAGRMRELVDDLLQYSRADTSNGPLAPVDMNLVARRVVDTMRATISESGADVSVHNLPLVLADEVQMAQVLQNLVSNAIKFRGDEPPRVCVACSKVGREWLFSVADNGIGIDPRYADNLFKMFQRLHTRDEYPGTGIGLAIVKKIVERHGGRVWVESQTGEGATFYFTLPVR